MDYKLSVTVYWNPSIIDRSFCWPVGHYNSFLMDDYPPINGFIYIIHKFWPWRMWFGPNHVQLRRRLKIHQKLDCKVQLKPCENERIFAAKKNLAWFIEKTYRFVKNGISQFMDYYIRRGFATQRENINQKCFWTLLKWTTQFTPPLNPTNIRQLTLLFSHVQPLLTINHQLLRSRV
jgi:hypothetical protein